jgi:hypothetical protein
MTPRELDALKKVVKLIKKAEKQRAAFNASIEGIKDFCEVYATFRCSVVDQPGDGFCLLDEDDGIVLAPLKECIRFIKKHGEITS